MRSIAFLALFLSVAGAAAGGQQPYQPTEIERARWTMSDMATWRTALAAYRQDHGTYPAAKNLEDVRAAVEKKYIAVAPMVDAWGNAYRYEALPDGYRITSAGADGRFDEQSEPARGMVPSLSNDAVATHEGRWLLRFWSLE